MKKSLLVLLLITTVSMGQGLLVFSGLSIPLGDYGDIFSPGMQYGASYTMKMPGIEPPVGTELKTEYLIGYTNYEGETNAIITKSDYTIIPIVANGILDMNPSAKDFGGLAPSLVLGIGYYLIQNDGTMELTDDTGTWVIDYDERTANVGINLGGGADYYLNKNFYLRGVFKYLYTLPISDGDTDSMSLFDIRIGAGFNL